MQTQNISACAVSSDRRWIATAEGKIDQDYTGEKSRKEGENKEGEMEMSGLLIVWDARRAAPVKTIPLTRATVAVALQESLVVIVSEATVALWQWSSAIPVLLAEEPLTNAGSNRWTVQWHSHLPMFLVCAPRALTLWNWHQESREVPLKGSSKQPESAGHLEGFAVPVTTNEPSLAALGPARFLFDSDVVITGTSEGEIIVWSAEDLEFPLQKRPLKIVK